MFVISVTKRDLRSGNTHKYNGHDDVIKWKYFPRYWPFVREIHRSPVNFPHKGQWRGALMFTLICARKNGWVNNGGAGDLRRYLAHYDVIVMGQKIDGGTVKWDQLPDKFIFKSVALYVNVYKYIISWEYSFLSKTGYCFMIYPSHISKNAFDKYPTMHHFVTEMHTCAYFWYKMMYCGIWD